MRCKKAELLLSHSLGLILLISLLIWRLIEHAMRTDLKQRNTTVPHDDAT